MAFEQADIVAIKQPIHLLSGQLNQFITGFRPFKLLFSQGFVIEYKTVVFPEQAFDFITLPIGESIQGAGEWIMSKFLFHQHRKAMGLFTKINRIAIEVNNWNVIGWA